MESMGKGLGGLHHGNFLSKQGVARGSHTECSVHAHSHTAPPSCHYATVLCIPGCVHLWYAHLPCASHACTSEESCSCRAWLRSLRPLSPPSWSDLPPVCPVKCTAGARFFDPWDDVHVGYEALRLFCPERPALHAYVRVHGLHAPGPCGRFKHRCADVCR
eukprot:355440-Chlamydomonas_euryale.AAC.3